VLKKNGKDSGEESDRAELRPLNTRPTNQAKASKDKNREKIGPNGKVWRVMTAMFHHIKQDHLNHRKGA